MAIDMNETTLNMIAQRQDFLKATPEVSLGGVGEKDGNEMCEHVRRVLKRFDDPPQMGRARRSARLLAAHHKLQPSPDGISLKCPAPFPDHKSDKKCVIGSKARFLGRKPSAVLNRNRGRDRHSADGFLGPA